MRFTKIDDASNKVIQVTEDGVALPPGGKILDELVEKPYRIDPDTGKFKEVLRIDPPTPRGEPGPEYSHYHINNSKEHFSPKPGNREPWPWD